MVTAKVFVQPLMEVVVQPLMEVLVQPPMEDSDSSSVKTSDAGDDDNKDDDGVASSDHCHFFEGVEKLLEVWFASSTGTT